MVQAVGLSLALLIVNVGTLASATFRFRLEFENEVYSGVGISFQTKLGSPKEFAIRSLISNGDLLADESIIKTLHCRICKNIGGVLHAAVGDADSYKDEVDWSPISVLADSQAHANAIQYKHSRTEYCNYEISVSGSVYTGEAEMHDNFDITPYLIVKKNQSIAKDLSNFVEKKVKVEEALIYKTGTLHERIAPKDLIVICNLTASSKILKINYTLCNSERVEFKMLLDEGTAKTGMVEVFKGPEDKRVSHVDAPQGWNGKLIFGNFYVGEVAVSADKSTEVQICINKEKWWVVKKSDVPSLFKYVGYISKLFVQVLILKIEYDDKEYTSHVQSYVPEATENKPTKWLEIDTITKGSGPICLNVKNVTTQTNSDDFSITSDSAILEKVKNVTLGFQIQPKNSSNPENVNWSIIRILSVDPSDDNKAKIFYSLPKEIDIEALLVIGSEKHELKAKLLAFEETILEPECYLPNESDTRVWLEWNEPNQVENLIGGVHTIGESSKMLLFVCGDPDEKDLGRRRMFLDRKIMGPGFKFAGKLMPKQVTFWIEPADQKIRYLIVANIDEETCKISIPDEVEVSEFDIETSSVRPLPPSTDWRKYVRDRRGVQFGINRLLINFTKESWQKIFVNVSSLDLGLLASWLPIYREKNQPEKNQPTIIDYRRNE